MHWRIWNQNGSGLSPGHAAPVSGDGQEVGLNGWTKNKEFDKSKDVTLMIWIFSHCFLVCPTYLPSRNIRCIFFSRLPPLLLLPFHMSLSCHFLMLLISLLLDHSITHPKQTTYWCFSGMLLGAKTWNRAINRRSTILSVMTEAEEGSDIVGGSRAAKTAHTESG